MNKTQKPKTGFFTFTCCEGCQFRILMIENIMDLLDKLDIVHFNILKETSDDTLLDLAFVEGAITTKAEIEELKKLRKKVKTLVALGTCAVSGGIPAMKNFVSEDRLHKYVYHHVKHQESVPVKGIENYVSVDYNLRGCPIIEEEFVEFIKVYLQGELPQASAGPVCMECPRKKNGTCFMKEKIDCMGSITHSGCLALCTGKNIPCTLCRGPLDTANITNEIKLFERFGLNEEEIITRLNLFMNL